MKIFLCGIKHAGKTVIGKALSQKCGIPFCDSDELLCRLHEVRTGKLCTPREIMSEHGSDYFRRIEADALADSIPSEGIIALGGGSLSNPCLSGEVLRELHPLCWLDVPDEVAYFRIVCEGLPPFLIHETDPFQTFCRINAERCRIFRQNADFALSLSGEETPDCAADMLLNLLNHKGFTK